MGDRIIEGVLSACEHCYGSGVCPVCQGRPADFTEEEDD